MSTSRISTRALATAAAACIAFFVAVVAILPLLQLGHYDISRQAISELALGSGGWLLNVAFCVMGAGAVALGLALRRSTGSAVAAVMFAVVGMLDVVSAIVHAVRYDAQATTASNVHQGAGILTFLLTIVAILLMVRTFRHSAGRQWFARPTLVWGCVSAAAFLFLGPGVMGETHFGITQRAMAVTFLSWMLTASALVALHDESGQQLGEPRQAQHGRAPGANADATAAP